ncbi:hypothetical protein G9A89_019692 [Geosiphon pyriformis]|nr:hypothetical protein G9A89_019692 [Geosiphon pyriformis]
MNKALIAIIGTTGVGKSDLAVQLAKALGGEIINGDSMQKTTALKIKHPKAQVYKGMDVITNKLPVLEREGIAHHLMDFLELQQEYKVTEFTKDALKIINKIHSCGLNPIVVGGTHYYIQNLLWKNSLIGSSSDIEEYNDSEHEDLNVETPILYKRLQEVDSIMANKWHHNDRRKIRRSLEIFLRTGKRHSEFIDEQHHPDEKGNSLRFSPTCIFWLYADPKSLNPRLDARVDKMIENGLFEEIQYLRVQAKRGEMKIPGEELDYTRGIWQAIGYKEFDPYLSAVEANKDSDQEIISKLENLKIYCIENMKAATRRYAKTQIRWIRNKFLPKFQQQNAFDTSRNGVSQIYMLDATSLDNWKKDVGDLAISIAREFLATGQGPDPMTINSRAAEYLKPTRNLDTSESINSWTKYQCEICNRIANLSSTPTADSLTDGAQNDTLDDSANTYIERNCQSSSSSSSSSLIITYNGSTEWQQHLKSKWHKSNVKLLRLIDESWGGQLPPWLKFKKQARLNQNSSYKQK